MRFRVQVFAAVRGRIVGRMGRASRSKAERRRLRQAQAAESAQRASVSEERARYGLSAFFTKKGPPSDFPHHAGLGVLLLGLLVAAGYYPALMAGFIWDDVIFTGAKPVREWAGLWDIWFHPKSLTREGHYWPVVYTSFWLEHKLWGFAPAGYHAVNLLLQLINSLLVWRLMLRLAVPGAWLIAAVFAVHPLHVESVAWIIERKDLLSGMFYMTAVLFWLRFMEVPRWRYYLLALGLFMVSLLCKTVTVTLPAALLVLHWWKRGRITVADILQLIPFFVAGFAITLGDLSYYSSREPLDLGYSLVERMQIASHALWFYLGKLLWPVDLAVVYPFWDVGIGNPAEWGYLFAAVALAVALWLLRSRIGRGPLVGALFFVVTLSPVLGFIDYGYMQFSLVADRFQYLAGIGVMAVLIGASTHRANRLTQITRKGLLGIALLGIITLTALSWQQSHIYRDEITFFSHIISHNPQARDAHHNLGKALQDVGRMDEALAAARIAITQRPDFASAYSNLGLALKHHGRLEEAEEVLWRGKEIDPRDGDLLQNLAEVIRQQGRHEESIKWYDDIIKRDQKYARAYAGKGDALFHLGRYGEASTFLRKALSLDPVMSQAHLIHTLIGEAEQKLGRFEEAKRHYESALQIDPQLFRAHTSLIGLLLEQQHDEEASQRLQIVRGLGVEDKEGVLGVAELFRKRSQYTESLEWYDRILGHDPDYTQAYVGKGDALFRLKRYEEAIEVMNKAIALDPDMSVVPTLQVLMGEAAQALGRLEEASELYKLVLRNNPRHVGALDRLAMVHYEQSRYEEALELYRMHIDIAPDNANAHSNLGIVLYEMGRSDEARKSLEHALSLDPDAAMAKIVLDLIHRGQ